MEKIFDWIDANRKKTLGIICGIIILPIAIVHILFKIKTGCSLLQAEYGPGDMLGYFGDVLSFLGTVILGYVAIRQTERANDISEKLMEMDIVKSKPCFDFVNSQLYVMTIKGDKEEIELQYSEEDCMILDLLYTSEPRSGLRTNIGQIELEVINTGHSDIRFVYVDKIRFYLSAGDRRNKNEKIAYIRGNTNLKVDEKKYLLIQIDREFLNDEDLNDTWYEDNAEKIMPHLELCLHLITIDGVDYYEKIKCVSNWKYGMKSDRNGIERELTVLKVDVSHEKSKMTDTW